MVQMVGPLLGTTVVALHEFQELFAVCLEPLGGMHKIYWNFVKLYNFKKFYKLMQIVGQILGTTFVGLQFQELYAMCW